MAELTSLQNRTLKIFAQSPLSEIFDRFEFLLTDREKLRLEFVYFEHPNLKPRKKWQDLIVDSLEDIAANKVMALFDLADPKDLVDIYFILKKIQAKEAFKISREKICNSNRKSSLWSECQKGLKDLDEITPFLIAKTKKEKERLLKKLKIILKSKEPNIFMRY